MISAMPWTKKRIPEWRETARLEVLQEAHQRGSIWAGSGQGVVFEEQCLMVGEGLLEYDPAMTGSFVRITEAGRAELSRLLALPPR